LGHTFPYGSTAERAVGAVGGGRRRGRGRGRVGGHRMRLANKVVVITGTGDGQGRAAAVRFAAEGATLVGCDLNEDAAALTEEMVRQSGGTMLSVAPLDLTAEDDVRTLIETAVERFGRIDRL